MKFGIGNVRSQFLKIIQGNNKQEPLFKQPLSKKPLL